MRKLTEITGEDALDVLADLIEPIANIGKNEITKKAMADKNLMLATKTMLKENKQDVIKIFAILEGVPVEEYEYNLLTLPTALIQLFSDEDVMRLFL